MTLEQLLHNKEFTGSYRGIAEMAKQAKCPDITISYESFERMLGEIDTLSLALYTATEALKGK